MKSITSGNLVEARVKQRQNSVVKTSPGDALARRQDVPKPTSSKKHPASQRRGREGENTEAFSSDHVSDLFNGPTAGPMLVPEERGRDIDRIMASVNILQREMVSLKESVEFLMDRNGQESQDFSGDVDIPAGDTIKVSSGLSELEALKLEMKTMQQRIKCIENSRSTGRWSPTVLGSAQISRRPSSTIDEAVTPRKGAPSNGLVLSTYQTPMSAYFDGVLAPQIHAPERHDAVDECDSLFTGLPVESKPEALPPQKLFTTKPRTASNGTASRGRHGPVSMPPPQTPCKTPGQNIIRRRSSYSTHVATPRTALTPIIDFTNSVSLPRIGSQRQETSTGSLHSHPESHIFDDELDDDIRPQSSTGPFTGNSRQLASKTAHSRRHRTNESIQRLPSKTQRRTSVPVAPPAPKASNENKPSTSHRESKRRKTTAFDANTSTTSTWTAESRELRSTGSRRGGQGLSVRIDREGDGRSVKFRK